MLIESLLFVVKRIFLLILQIFLNYVISIILQHIDRNLQLSISTNGNAPKLAALLCAYVAGLLPKGIGKTIERVGILRQKIREFDPTPGSASRRMKWMSGVCEAFPMDQLLLTDEEVDVLLILYKKNKDFDTTEVRETVREARYRLKKDKIFAGGSIFSLLVGLLFLYLAFLCYIFSFIWNLFKNVISFFSFNLPYSSSSSFSSSLSSSLSLPSSSSLSSLSSTPLSNQLLNQLLLKIKQKKRKE
jgi:hypothetical protein